MGIKKVLLLSMSSLQLVAMDFSSGKQASSDANPSMTAVQSLVDADNQARNQDIDCCGNCIITDDQKQLDGNQKIGSHNRINEILDSVKKRGENEVGTEDDCRVTLQAFRSVWRRNGWIWWEYLRFTKDGKVEKVVILWGGKEIVFSPATIRNSMFSAKEGPDMLYRNDGKRI